MTAAGTALLVVAVLLVALPAPAADPPPEPAPPLACTSCHAEARLRARHPAPEAAAGQPCATCHEPARNEWPAPNRFSARLHRSHVRDGAPVACAACHESAGREADLALLRRQFASWASSPHLDASHARADVSCGGCHGVAMPARGATVEAGRCMACHGFYECLADRTAPALHPERNPHSSHLGQPACTSCHHAHRPSRVVCVDCHPDLAMTIPPRAAR